MDASDALADGVEPHAASPAEVVLPLSPWALLLRLPENLQIDVVARLSVPTRRAVHSACRLGRQLANLGVRHVEYEIEWATALPQDLLARFPNATSLTYTCVLVPHQRIALPAPAPKLRTLSLRVEVSTSTKPPVWHPDYAACADLLACTPALRSLTIHSPPPSHRAIPPSTPLFHALPALHQHLTHLALLWTGPLPRCTPIAVLSTLSNLHSLTLQGFTTPHALSSPHLPTLLSPLSHLTTLTLHEPLPPLLTAAASAPALRTLTLLGGTLRAGAFDPLAAHPALAALTITNPARNLFLQLPALQALAPAPALHTLDLQPPFATDADLATLAALTTLRSLTLALPMTRSRGLFLASTATALPALTHLHITHQNLTGPLAPALPAYLGAHTALCSLTYTADFPLALPDATPFRHLSTLTALTHLECSFLPVTTPVWTALRHCTALATLVAATIHLHPPTAAAAFAPPPPPPPGPPPPPPPTTRTPTAARAAAAPAEPPPPSTPKPLQQPPSSTATPPPGAPAPTFHPHGPPPPPPPVRHPSLLTLHAQAEDATPPADDCTLHLLAASAPALQSLYLSNCSSVTDAGLRCLSHSCPSLRHLTLRHLAPSVTLAGGLRHLSALGGLQRLYVHVPPQVGCSAQAAAWAAGLGAKIRYLGKMFAAVKAGAGEEGEEEEEEEEVGEEVVPAEGGAGNGSGGGGASGGAQRQAARGLENGELGLARLSL